MHRFVAFASLITCATQSYHADAPRAWIRDPRLVRSSSSPRNLAGTYSSELQFTIVQSKSQTKRIEGGGDMSMFHGHKHARSQRKSDRPDPAAAAKRALRSGPLLYKRAVDQRRVFKCELKLMLLPSYLRFKVRAGVTNCMSLRATRVPVKR